MTTHRVCDCKDCGVKYTLRTSGWGRSNYNAGANRDYCKKCAPKHYVKPKPRDWEWVLTDEVTSDQMFKWDEEDREAQQKKYDIMSERLKKSNDWKDFHMPFRRSYLGFVKADGSDAEDAIWTHGYRMVFWRRSREVVSIHKRVKLNDLE